VIFVAKKKGGSKIFFPSPLLFDPGWMKIGIRINIPDPQNCQNGFLASLNYIVASAGNLNKNFVIKKFFFG
jgi:hypothetical protein